MKSTRWHAFAWLLLAVCGAGRAHEPDRRIVVTIDDLPWQQFGEGIAHAEVPTQHRQLVEALRAAAVPVVGFVNEAKLELGGELQPERLQMLRDWLDAGAELGNHTYAHLDVHRVGLAEFQADILRGERQLRPLLAARETAPRWFRHPYLRAGRTLADKTAIADFLATHGYRIAPVTVDNSEWIWARAYRLVLERPDVASAPNQKLLDRLRREFVPYMMRKVAYYEQQSQSLLGYDLPQILLLHANALNAATYGQLIAALRVRGYRFIDLDEALKDPAYARPDGYLGAYGPSWLHRWAIAEKRPDKFFAGEPATAPWVMQLAGVDSE